MTTRADKHESSGRTLTISELRAYDGPPLILFVGITTAGSGAHKTFPAWAPLLAPDAILRGLDLPEDAAAEQFRELVFAMRDNRHIDGAVITSHKLRLYRAAHDVIDVSDPFVDLTHEINCLDSRNGLLAYARDPQSLDLVLKRFTQPERAAIGRPIVCIGAGGSATALLLAVRLDVPASLVTSQPILRSASNQAHLTIVDRQQAALNEIDAARQRCGIDASAVDLLLAPDAPSVGEILRHARPGSIVANATGLGKTSPHSPLPDNPQFPEAALAWDFNYRGPLTFLEQARRAGVATEDGWLYFVAGWAAALASITGRQLTAGLFSEAARAAEPIHVATRGPAESTADR